MADNENMKLEGQSIRSKNQIKAISPLWKYGEPDAAVKETMYKIMSFWDVSAYHKYHKKCHKKHKITKLKGIHAQLVNSSGGLLTDGSNVIFDTLINNQSTAISYNAITGEFTIKALGTYYLTWWVATDGTAGPSTVTFVINKNGGESISGSSPLVTGQVIGSALITVDAKPSIITLVNNTTNIVAFAATPVQANIIITEVSI